MFKTPQISLKYLATPKPTVPKNVINQLTNISGHSFEILRLPLPGPALLSRWGHNRGAIEVGHLGGRARVRDRRCRGLKRHGADVTVRMLRVHRVMGMRRMGGVVVVMVKELRRGERLAGVVGTRWVNRNWRTLGGVQFRAHLVVQSAKDCAVPHPEVVALGQGYRAGGAGKAANVENEITGSHHQLRGQDRCLTPGAPLHAAEHPGNRGRGLLPGFQRGVTPVLWVRADLHIFSYAFRT